MSLRFENKRFELWRGFQSQYGGVGIVVILLQLQLDALTFKGAGVGLDLHILVQQTVNGLLRLVKLYGHGRLCVQLELLFYGFGEIPAKEDKGVLAMAFGVKKTPGFIRRAVQGVIGSGACSVYKFSL